MHNFHYIRTGPAIYQFQQADDIFNAFTANVIGLTLAVEGYNIVKGWETKPENKLATLKDGES
jgi:hypothetical protein